MTIIYFIIALGILVLVHEWGHFIVARRAGIRVEKFSIGFGPKLFGVQRGETEFRVSILPLGGYVKLFGEDPVAEADGDEKKAREIAQSKDAFSAKPLRHRFITVMAGPVMNLILCFLLMPLVFMLGRQLPSILIEPPEIIGIKADSPAAISGFQDGDRILEIDGRAMDNWTDVIYWVMLYPDHKANVSIDRNGEQLELSLQTITSPHTKQKIGYAGFEPLFFWGNEPIVGTVSPDSPASKAGFRAKDVILTIDGQKVASWSDMTEMIRGSLGKKKVISYKRGGKIKKVAITPVYNENIQTWIVGITKYVNPDNYIKKRYGFFESIKKGTKENLKLFALTGDVLSRLLTFQLSYKALGGPVQIAEATGAAARTGLGGFVYFLAFLSMQLGILNLLPIPVLDGGHILFMGIEGIRRRPVSIKVRNFFTQMGLAFLLGLMVLITFNDIDRIWGLSSIWEKVRGIF